MCSCTTVYEAQGPGTPAAASQSTSEHSILNNTSYLLDITQDSRTIFTGLRPGQVLPVKTRLFGGASNVIATGYTEDGQYVGAAAWTFLWNVPEVWMIHGVVAQR